MILREKPANVICMGDLGQLDSVSRHGERIEVSLKQDVEAMRYAQELTFGPIDAWSRRQRQSRHAGHDMGRILIKGNHEDRVDRARKEDPMGLPSLVDFDDVAGFTSYWDVVAGYGEGVHINGIWYTHCVRGDTGRPIALSTAANRVGTHTVVGHTHRMDSRSTPLATGGVRFVMSMPAFMPDGYVADYARGTTHGWTYGLLRVRPQGPDRVPGIEYVTMRDLKEMYG